MLKAVSRKNRAACAPQIKARSLSRGSCNNLLCYRTALNSSMPTLQSSSPPGRCSCISRDRTLSTCPEAAAAAAFTYLTRHTQKSHRLPSAPKSITPAQSPITDKAANLAGDASVFVSYKTHLSAARELPALAAACLPPPPLSLPRATGLLPTSFSSPYAAAADSSLSLAPAADARALLRRGATSFAFVRRPRRRCDFGAAAAAGASAAGLATPAADCRRTAAFAACDATSAAAASAPSGAAPAADTLADRRAAVRRGGRAALAGAAAAKGLAVEGSVAAESSYSTGSGLTATSGAVASAAIDARAAPRLARRGGRPARARGGSLLVVCTLGRIAELRYSWARSARIWQLLHDMQD